MTTTDKTWWSSYVVPPIAAAGAIIPAFPGMVAKSALQRGQKVVPMTFASAVRGGIGAAPTVGVIVGTQMIAQSVLQSAMGKESGLASTLASSAIVGIVSAPPIAIFNGKTMGWSVWESLRRISFRQCLAIATQETAFVSGLSIAKTMKGKFGDHQVVDYTATFFTAALGSLVGHPANTALTRWQSGMPIENVGQLFWGAMRRARAVGLFAIVFKFGREIV